MNFQTTNQQLCEALVAACIATQNHSNPKNFIAFFNSAITTQAIKHLLPFVSVDQVFDQFYDKMRELKEERERPEQTYKEWKEHYLYLIHCRLV